MLEAFDDVLGHGLSPGVAADPSGSIKNNPVAPAIDEFADSAMPLDESVHEAILGSWQHAKKCIKFSGWYYGLDWSNFQEL